MTTVKIENARLSFPALFTPSAFEGSDNLKYSAVFILDKESDGEEIKARALYLKLRVQHLQDEQFVHAQKSRTEKRRRKQQVAKREQDRKDINAQKAAEAARQRKQEEKRKRLELERQEFERLSSLPERSFPFMNWVYFAIFVSLFFLVAHLLIEYGKNL